MSVEREREAVLGAARRRARALADRDADMLRALMHPALTWTTHRGAVLDRDEYIRGNTESELIWREQRLEDADVTVVGGTAVLTAVVVDVVEEGGIERTNVLRLTQTWVSADGAWRCLAGHAGPPVGT